MLIESNDLHDHLPAFGVVIGACSIWPDGRFAPDLEVRVETGGASLDVPRGEGRRERLATVAGPVPTARSEAIVERVGEIRAGDACGHAAVRNGADVHEWVATCEVSCGGLGVYLLVVADEDVVV